ncbi:hypothetical protein GOC06_21325 [Sinorhizobium meliloti]|uniref:hypothetical protein n=1 Tax=Rhizobium meliloti TaxID=382 RepID=UPI0004F5BE67|nr:hypothetical protein [Sinorhizobium meliloti]AIL99968.1 hypothetical protein DU99_11415 [Sinorhizobium meliloti]MCO6424725.1 hypothetical protein [Sinorhizobium meliloti]MDX0195966.1 hypothetical protein [Sinorhizobium meliloti]MDX0255201.1 hypothetical protein [Sinorhizobium meliloti]MDX0298341.1 hypothetical protein [Sinorhizobium meliloti]
MNRSILYMLSITALLPSPGLASDHARYLAACEEVIKARQPVPGLYRIKDYSVDEHRLTRDEFAKVLADVGANKEFTEKQLTRFDRKDTQPVDWTFVIDYEATDKNSAVVQKRSECKMRANRPTDEIMIDFIEVDGLTEFERK